MTGVYITHYYRRGTDPWQNIMLLSEEKAFETAQKLAAEHTGEQCFGRFADFVNYYPKRRAADEEVLRQFTALGGRPLLDHPYSFVLMECEYLKNWFGDCDSLRIPLDMISDDRISFTVGDSCARYDKEGQVEVFTRSRLCENIRMCGSIEKYMEKILTLYKYIEVQLWERYDL